MNKSVSYLFLSSLLLASNLSFAGTGDVSSAVQPHVPSASAEFADIFTLQNIIADASQSVQELVATVNSNDQAYKQLGYFQFGARYDLSQNNCNVIKGTLGGTATVIAATLQSMSADLSQIPELNTDQASTAAANLKSFSQEMVEASNSCDNPGASLVHVKNAANDLSQANAFFSKLNTKQPPRK